MTARVLCGTVWDHPMSNTRDVLRYSVRLRKRGRLTGNAHAEERMISSKLPRGRAVRAAGG